jgi:hypothetical protein
MRVAWFRPEGAEGAAADLADVIDGLRPNVDVQVVTRDRAHDFVWQHARGMFDICVYELANTPAHQYIWPYLLHYPGVLALRASSLHDSRAKALIWEHRTRDYEAEIAFGETSRRLAPPWHLARGGWPMWRIPVLASRLTAVADPALAATVHDACPGARIALIPAGVSAPSVHDRPPTGTRPVRVAVADTRDPALTHRALERSRAAGAVFEVVTGGAYADVVVATRWPLKGRPLTAALAGAATGAAVVVAETEATAGWPALDPQTWRTRRLGPGPADAPVAVSIDPRDEEHSLMLAITRLSADAALRESLGAAARDWWARTGTVAHAVAAWRTALDDARGCEPLPRPDGWPAHLDDDASGRAREILESFGLSSALARV